MNARSPRWVAYVLALSYVAAIVLLGKLTRDLAGLDPRFAVPAWGVFGFAFAIAGWNVLRILRDAPTAEVPRGAPRTLLVLAIPLAFVASTLDCMGLSLEGCTEVCGLLVQAGLPAVALTSLLYLATGMRLFLALATVLPLAFLYPNCACRNPLNADWIDWLGRSPACFASAFGVSVIALAALHTGKLVRSSIVACWVIVAGMLAFFVGHHYFDYPW